MMTLKRIFAPALALAMILTFVAPADAHLSYDASTGDVLCSGGCQMTVYDDGTVVFQDSNGSVLEMDSNGDIFYDGF